LFSFACTAGSDVVFFALWSSCSSRVLGLRSGPSPGLIFPFCRRADFGRCSQVRVTWFSHHAPFLSGGFPVLIFGLVDSSLLQRSDRCYTIFLPPRVRLPGPVPAQDFPLAAWFSRVIATVGYFCRRVLFSRCPVGDFRCPVEILLEIFSVAGFSSASRSCARAPRPGACAVARPASILFGVKIF
jgi:hypothetical protein